MLRPALPEAAASQIATAAAAAAFEASPRSQPITAVALLSLRFSQCCTSHAAMAVLAGACPAPATPPQLMSSPASPQAAVTPTLQTASPSQAKDSSLMEWCSPVQLAIGQPACSSGLANHVLQRTQHFLRAQLAQKTVWYSPGGQWQAVDCRSHVPKAFMGQGGMRVMPTACALSALRAGRRLKALRTVPATAEVRCSAVWCCAGCGDACVRSRTCSRLIKHRCICAESFYT